MTEVSKGHETYWSEARAVLTTLGFRGLTDFAAQAGISPMTAEKILGLRSSKHCGGIFPRKAILVHEVLHSAYLSRHELRGPQRAFIKDWVSRWKKYIMRRIHVEKPGKWVLVDRKSINAREERHRVVERQTLASLKRLEWR